MTLTDIEQKMLQLEAGMFQKMCNEILCKMNYKPYNYKGSQSGTYKTVLGTPDAIFQDANNMYVYVEYTVQQTDLSNKIQEDVKKCLKNIKEENLENKFSKIIYMHNCKNIPPSINEEIKKICENVEFEIYGMDFIANLIKNKFPEIAKDYLDLQDNNIQMVTMLSEECIQQISETIKDQNSKLFKGNSVDEIKKQIDDLYNETVSIINNEDSQFYISDKNKERLEEIFATLKALEFYYKDNSDKETKQYYQNNLIILSKINFESALEYYKRIPEPIKEMFDIKLLHANFLLATDRLNEAECILYDLYYNKKYSISIDSLVRCYFLNQKYDKVIHLLNGAKKEDFDKYGFMAAMYIISKNFVKKYNEKEILKLNGSKFKEMPLFYTATSHLLFYINKKNNKYKEQFKKGLKYLNSTDVIAISTMCDEARAIKLYDEMISYLYCIELTPYLKIKLIELLMNKASLEEADIEKLQELKLEIDQNYVDVDYIEARILETQGKEIDAITRYEESYYKKKSLGAAYKYIELSMKTYSKINKEIIENLSRDNNIQSLMLVVEAYKYNYDFENAIKNSYKVLYLLKGKTSNKQCLKQYWASIMLSGDTLYREIDYVCKDVVVTIEYDKDKKIKNYVLEDDEFFCEGEKILNTEIIRTSCNLAIDLINKKKDDIIILEGKKCIIKDVKDKYTYFSSLCFGYLDIENDKNVRVLKSREDDLEGLVQQIKEILNEEKMNNSKRLDYYQESANLPLSFFFSSEKSVTDYAKIISGLLNEKERALYAGEPREIDIEEGCVIDLTSIIVLAIYKKLDLFTDELCKKIYITTSLKNKFQYFYEDLLKKQGKEETTIGMIKNESGESKLAINEIKINDSLEFWKLIYKVINKFVVENVEAEKNELLGDKRIRYFDKVQFDLMELAKQKNLPFICDDLFIRRIAGGMYGIKHTNCISILKYFYEDDYLSYLDETNKMVNDNYIHVFFVDELTSLLFMYYKNLVPKDKMENIVKGLLNSLISFKTYIDAFINMLNGLKSIEYIKIRRKYFLK